MTLKHLVLALATATACAVAPSSRGSTEAVGDTFEKGNDVLIADIGSDIRYLAGGPGADDSCTLNGDPKTEASDGSKYFGCE